MARHTLEITPGETILSNHRVNEAYRVRALTLSTLILSYNDKRVITPVVVRTNARLYRSRPSPHVHLYAAHEISLVPLWESIFLFRLEITSVEITGSMEKSVTSRIEKESGMCPYKLVFNGNAAFLKTILSDYLLISMSDLNVGT